MNNSNQALKNQREFFCNVETFCGHVVFDDSYDRTITRKQLSRLFDHEKLSYCWFDMVFYGVADLERRLHERGVVHQLAVSPSSGKMRQDVAESMDEIFFSLADASNRLGIFFEFFFGVESLWF